MPQYNNILDAAKNTHWFEQGNPNAPHQLYAIIEPNCSACHYFYGSISPYLDNGTLTVRWILVAFLKPSSAAKAAAIISSKNMALALEKNESAFHLAIEEGGVMPARTITTAEKQILENNLAFMNHYDFDSTPIIIFRKQDKTIGILKGAPSEAQLPRVLAMVGKY